MNAIFSRNGFLVSRCLAAVNLLVEIGSAEPWLVCAYANVYRKDRLEIVEKCEQSIFLSRREPSEPLKEMLFDCESIIHLLTSSWHFLAIAVHVQDALKSHQIP
ncbi:hypothetical protein M513_05460 [Trichuris suis]|uniref:Uncharacterized protein n=1 Tax=Trichuris suis TaxID=68888 RepID=A0A085M8J8_9BILA|nr:hypothetical protein M513_05460 [Trichuris suis]